MIFICTEAILQVEKWRIKSLSKEINIKCIEAVGSASIKVLVCLELLIGQRPFRMPKKMEV
jgi:hypothetical protein